MEKRMIGFEVEASAEEWDDLSARWCRIKESIKIVGVKRLIMRAALLALAIKGLISFL